jgi:hypothetical protein
VTKGEEMALPNARSTGEDGKATYKRVGDNLKIRYAATRGETGWIEFDPSCMEVELNGQPLTTCQEVVLIIRDGFPVVTLTLNLETVDVDADTLTRLQAIVDARKDAAPE